MDDKELISLYESRSESAITETDKKYRGRLNHVLMEYAEDLKPSLEHARKNRVFVTHSGCDQEIEDSIVQFLADMHHFDEIHVTRAGSVISTLSSDSSVPSSYSVVNPANTLCSP